jgi:hypothetical protein
MGAEHQGLSYTATAALAKWREKWWAGRPSALPVRISLGGTTITNRIGRQSDRLDRVRRRGTACDHRCIATGSDQAD